MNAPIFKPTPLEAFDKLHSQLSVIKAQRIGVYDNLYAKPSQSGVPTNARFSVSVIFSVNGILHYGQYDFENGIWSTSPGDEKMRKFRDRVVEFWFYPPGATEMFKEYAKDVRSGACRDEYSRLDEYDPDRQEYHMDAEEKNGHETDENGEGGESIKTVADDEDSEDQQTGPGQQQGTLEGTR